MPDCVVLVTGGAGFVGGHMRDLLIERGFRVIGGVEPLRVERHRASDHFRFMRFEAPALRIWDGPTFSVMGDGARVGNVVPLVTRSDEDWRADDRWRPLLVTPRRHGLAMFESLVLSDWALLESDQCSPRRPIALTFRRHRQTRDAVDVDGLDALVIEDGGIDTTSSVVDPSQALHGAMSHRTFGWGFGTPCDLAPRVEISGRLKDLLELGAALGGITHRRLAIKMPCCGETVATPLRGLGWLHHALYVGASAPTEAQPLSLLGAVWGSVTRKWPRLFCQSVSRDDSSHAADSHTRSARKRYEAATLALFSDFSRRALVAGTAPPNGPHHDGRRTVRDHQPVDSWWSRYALSDADDVERQALGHVLDVVAPRCGSRTFASLRYRSASEGLRRELTLEALRYYVRALRAMGDATEPVVGVVNRRPSFEATVRVVLWEHGIDLEVGRLDDLPGCLVQGGSGATVYVNAELPPDERARVALHELGHVRLGHRPGSEWGFDDRDVLMEERLLYAEQETEAEDFAHLWTEAFLVVVVFCYGEESGSPSRKRFATIENRNRLDAPVSLVSQSRERVSLP